MTRWLVPGAEGMLGRDVVAALAGQDVTALDRAGLDITDPDAVAWQVAEHDVVVNCAAWTAVDDAETHEAEAFAVNALGPAVLAAACARFGVRLVQVSTDYVFGAHPAVGDGTAWPGGIAPRPHAEEDPVSPRSAYGRTKAAGEWAVRAALPERHWIVRTAWLYGRHGGSFVRTMADLEARRDFVDVVDDQHGQPTWTVDVAERIRDLVEADAPAGTYHATSSGHTTWHGLAAEVFTLLGADPDRVRRTTSAQFVRPAPRPAWSVLGHDGWARCGFKQLPDWRESLRRALVEEHILDEVGELARALTRSG